MEARGHSTSAEADRGWSDASRYPLALLARLVEAGLAEVVITADGTPELQVDPIFEQARAAVLAGLADADHAREVVPRTVHHLRPTG